MPHGRAVGLDLDREQALHQAEQAGGHGRLREVFLHFLGREGVALLAQFFRHVGQVPSFHLLDAQFVLGEGAQLGQVLLGERTGAPCQVFQELDHVFRALRHFRHQRHFGEVAVVEQLGFLVAQLEQSGDVAGVVPLFQFAEYGPHFRGLGGAGAVDGFAQAALVGELQHREVGREVQRELPACLAILLGGGARGLLDVLGDAGQLALVLDQQLVVVGGVEHVFREAGGHGRVLFLDLGEALLFGRRQLGAAQAEVAHGVLDDLAARRRQRRVGGAGLDRLVFGEQRLVLRQRGPELGDLRLVLVVGGAQRGRVDHVVEMVDHAPGAAQPLGGLLERGDEVVPGDLGAGRFERADDRAGVGDQLLDGGRDVLGFDGVEARQAAEVEQGIGGIKVHRFIFPKFIRRPGRRGPQFSRARRLRPYSSATS